MKQVQHVIETGIGGSESGQVFEGQRRFRIVVRLPENLRNSFENLRNVPIKLPEGGYIPLKQVANIYAEEGPREIARENNWRRAILGINIGDMDVGTYVENLQKKID